MHSSRSDNTMFSHSVHAHLEPDLAQQIHELAERGEHVYRQVSPLSLATTDVRFGIWLTFFRCFAFGVFQSLNKFVGDLDDLCYAKHGQAVEQTLKLPVTLNAMTLMWHHCNGLTLCSLQLKKLLSQSMSKSQTGFRTEVCPKNVWIRLPRSLRQIPDCETRIVSIEHMFAEFRHGNVVSTTLMSPQPFNVVWTSLSPTIWFSRSILGYRTSLKLFDKMS